MEFAGDRRTLGPLSKGSPSHVLIQRTLPRLLAFAGWSIDDVVSNPIAKRDLQRWYKTDLRLKRMMDVSELERQWNGLRS